MAGNIAKRPDGRWRARYRDEAGQERARHFDRKVDAQRWLDEVTTSVFTGNYVDPQHGRISFADFYAEWSTRQVWAEGTRTAADAAAATVPFGSTPLASLRRSHVEQWIKTMSARLAPTTVRTRYNYVALCLRGAVSDRIITHSPADGVRLPKVRRAAVAMTIPSPQEVGTAIAVAPAPFRAYLAVCAFAGLRQGEANALQLRDVDFLRRTLAVSRQIQGNTRGSTRVALPKAGSERVVYVPEDLTSLLGEHVATHGTQGADGWLFGDADTRLNRNSSGHMWRGVRAACGMEAFTLHDLRHFYASGLIASGCDVVTVQRSLGHSSPSITLDTYAHLWPTAEDRTRKAAAGLMDAALRDPTLAVERPGSM
jgi:integrase